MKALENELTAISANMGSQVIGKDEIIKQLQEQVTHWRNKYESLAKLYTQLRTEHLELLSKSKQIQLKANSAQEAIDKMERMERDIKAKNLELEDLYIRNINVQQAPVSQFPILEELIHIFIIA